MNRKQKYTLTGAAVGLVSSLSVVLLLPAVDEWSGTFIYISMIILALPSVVVDGLVEMIASPDNGSSYKILLVLVTTVFYGLLGLLLGTLLRSAKSRS